MDPIKVDFSKKNSCVMLNVSLFGVTKPTLMKCEAFEGENVSNSFSLSKKSLGLNKLFLGYYK